MPRAKARLKSTALFGVTEAREESEDEKCLCSIGEFFGQFLRHLPSEDFSVEFSQERSKS